jgi:multicomponent Na+:H+ antiporter subunit G
VTLLELISAGFIVVGLVFFAAGTLGMLRFPDIFTRLHALTKADNVGLGFVVIGLAIGAESVLEAFELLAIWGLVMLASTTACHVISAMALEQGVSPWEDSP